MNLQKKFIFRDFVTKKNNYYCDTLDMDLKYWNNLDHNILVWKMYRHTIEYQDQTMYIRHTTLVHIHTATQTHTTKQPDTLT